MESKAKTGRSKPQSTKQATPKADRAIRVQYGVLPYRFTDIGSLEMLLVTTRETKRWIIPKGWPIKGLKPPKSAAREAYEEAGIRGTVGKNQSEFFCTRRCSRRRLARCPAKYGYSPCSLSGSLQFGQRLMNERHDGLYRPKPYRW